MRSKVYSPLVYHVLTARNSIQLHYKYPVKVMADLQNGMITGKEKTKFVASVAVLSFSAKATLTREKYDHVF